MIIWEGPIDSPSETTNILNTRLPLTHLPPPPSQHSYHKTTILNLHPPQKIWYQIIQLPMIHQHLQHSQRIRQALSPGGYFSITHTKTCTSYQTSSQEIPSMQHSAEETVNSAPRHSKSSLDVVAPETNLASSPLLIMGISTLSDHPHPH